MKPLLRLFCISSLFLSVSTLADSMEFGLSNDMVEAVYQSDFGKNYNMQFNYMHADQDEFKSNSFGAGLYAQGQSGRFTSNLGGKLYWMEGSDARSYGIALGGSAAYAITPEFSLAASLLGSPNIINGGDFETLYDFDIRASYKVMQHASLFIAYRDSETSINSFDFEIYKGAVLGFKFAM